MSIQGQPFRVPIAKMSDGTPVYITREWWNYLGVDLIRQLGGSTGSSTTELEAAIAELQTVDLLTRRVTDLTRKVKQLEAQLGVER